VQQAIAREPHAEGLVQVEVIDTEELVLSLTREDAALYPQRCDVIS
jgi:hypothetical protein